LNPRAALPIYSHELSIKIVTGSIRTLLGKKSCERIDVIEPINMLGEHEFPTFAGERVRDM
jgi:hypothetical protein